MIDYHLDEKHPWIISETSFSENNLAKFESIFSQGNGRLGIRASLEESYVGETRNTFVSGTFNKAFDNEVTELPNLMDMTRFDIQINNRRFNLLEGKTEKYDRSLNLKTGEIIRRFTWISPSRHTFEFTFRRFVSQSHLSFFAHKISVKNLSNEDVTIRIDTGIDGTLTNTGSQHLTETRKRVYDGQILQYGAYTNQSGIYILANSMCRFFINDKEMSHLKAFSFNRRKAMFNFEHQLSKQDTLTIEKLNTIDTSRDFAFEDKDENHINTTTKKSILSLAEKRYSAHQKENDLIWQGVWDKQDIKIDSESPFDQLAIRFAQYHLHIMTPAHDQRMNIGAKGLSGEGYKGHTFWDSDIFILPFWIYTDPEVARKLLEYRYLSLEGARAKAQKYGYKGAMFPWESAWIDNGEVTPTSGGTNVVTGEPEKIITGTKEIHITGDVAYAIWHYYNMTNDQDFMNQMGYQVIFEAALFWSSRLEWEQEKQRYEITDVIGPDEYKERINNNFYTNYLAKWTIDQACDFYLQLKKDNTSIFKSLNDQLDLDELYDSLISVKDYIYVPSPNDDAIIPQDDTYLTLKEIDIEPYKKSEKVGKIQEDYNMSQISKLKVSKQADVMVTFLLFKNLYNQTVKKKNFEYYERFCTHDSSLSLSTYAIMAKETGDINKAYELFKASCNIDLGENMKSSDAGIHSASLGGIWQSVVLGFLGIRHDGDKLTINPKLPNQWHKIDYKFRYLGGWIKLHIDQNEMTVSNIDNIEDLNIIINGHEYSLKQSLTVEME